jgi:hypothetical protein
MKLYFMKKNAFINNLFILTYYFLLILKITQKKTTLGANNYYISFFCLCNH